MTVMIAANPDGPPLARIVPVGNGVDPATVPDSTAGVQTAIDQAPTGATVVLPLDVRCSGGLTVWGNKELVLVKADGTPTTVYAPDAYAWRPQPDRRKTVDGAPNPNYNPVGVCAPWLYDVNGGSLSNPYCRKGADGKPNVTGGQFGGYDGSTGSQDGSSGLTYDGRHFYTWVTNPFDPVAHNGKVLRACPNVYNPDDNFNVPIVGVEPKRLTFNDPNKVASAEGATHTAAWCIEPKKGWGCIFLPNPAWKPQWWGDDWHGYDKALDRAIRNCRGRLVIDVRAGSHLIGAPQGYGEVVGSNAHGQAALSNFAASNPLVNEFQDGVNLAQGAVADGVYVHHQWGTGIDGPGERKNFKIDVCGRQCMVGHYPGLRASNGIIQGAKHTAIDFETEKDIVDVEMTDITVGGPHGISVHAPVHGVKLTRVHSTKADIAAGHIRELAPLMAGTGGPSWGHSKPGSDIALEDCQFDVEQHTLLRIHNVDGVTVRDSRGNVTDYLVTPYDRADEADRCTNIVVSASDGGPNCNGLVAP